MYPSSHLTNLTSSLNSQQRQTSALQSLMFDLTGACTWEVSVFDWQTYWDGPVAAVLGLPMGSAPNLKSVIALMTPETHLHLAYALDTCLTSQISFDEKGQLATAQGNHRWVRLAGFTECDVSGAVVRMRGVLQDVTREVVAQQNSLAVTMRLGATLASISEAFATLDHEGRLTFVNPFCQQLLRSTDSQLLGHPHASGEHTSSISLNLFKN